MVNRSEAVSIWGDGRASAPRAPWVEPPPLRSGPMEVDPAGALERGQRAARLAARCAGRGRLARAERLARFAYGQVRRSGRDVREIVFLLGQIALAHGRPEDAGPWFHLALAASDRGRPADALDIEALLWLAVSAFAHGDLALAETRLTAAVRWASQREADAPLAARCRGFLGWIRARAAEPGSGVDDLDFAATALRRHRQVPDATAFDALCAAAEARSGQASRAHRRLASARVTTSPSVQPLLDLSEAVVELSEARWAFEHGEVARAQRLTQAARARADSFGTEPVPGPPERWIQRRLLVAILRELERPLAVGTHSGPVIEVARDGAWFRDVDAHEAPVGCERRPVLRRLLVELAHQRVAHPGRPIPGTELFAAGWPDQRISPASAKNRLKVAISTLRKMGFGPAILGDRSGYRIDPRVTVRWVDRALG